MKLNDFLYPQRQYHGASSQPKDIVFHAHLQEFSQRVSILTSLNTGGKLPSHETYKQLKKLYKQLKKLKHGLGIK